MHPFLERAMDRPMSHKVGFWIFSLVFISFIFWQYFYSEQLVKEEELQQKLDKLNTEVAHERRLARDLGKFREEVRQLDIKLKVVLRELPDKREIPDLLDSFSTLAKEAGLEVVAVKPLPEIIREFYAEVPVSVSVEGTFHQVATFFDEIGKLSRVVNINQITLKEPQVLEDRVVVKSDCMATTFRYLEESERVAAPQEAEARKRRRK